MKRIGLFLLVGVVMAGVAGCRNEGTGPECPAYYCGRLCSDAIGCDLFVPSNVDGCMSICTTMSIGRDDVGCQDLYAPATNMSCDELKTFFFGPPTALDVSGKRACFAF
ncbi:MAG TPA: hypothetical protein VI078_16255 [bacterium]